MAQYRKKPVVIEAIQYTGTNQNEIIEWVEKNKVMREVRIPLDNYKPITIITLEGEMAATPLDFLIIGVKREVYPCKPAIFELTYEKVE